MSADKYLLRVTTGPSYDPSTHKVVAVNGPTSTTIESSQCTASIKVRIQNYRGLPRGSPSTSTYFSHPPHEYDQYSIAFSMVPHRNVPSNDLVFGNDFDRPIRDRLPPGFSLAFGIVKRVVDPGLDGDVYADKPYLYGPLVSSINAFRVGSKVAKKGGRYEIPPEVHEDGIQEGADDEEAEEHRSSVGMPSEMAARKSWGLKEESREKFALEEGRIYRGDFYNPYLDFNEFALKLPGFSLGVLRFLGGQDSLRYTLKDRKTGEVFFVVVVTLILKEDVERAEAEAKSESHKESDVGKKEEKSNNDDDDVD